MKICLHCKQEFVPENRNREAVYCGQPCANKALGAQRVKYSRETLEQMARCGIRNTKIATALGMEINSVRKALRREGLYRTWQQARYAKCRVQA